MKTAAFGALLCFAVPAAGQSAGASPIAGRTRALRSRRRSGNPFLVAASGLLGGNAITRTFVDSVVLVGGKEVVPGGTKSWLHIFDARRTKPCSLQTGSER